MENPIVDGTRVPDSGRAWSAPRARVRPDRFAFVAAVAVRGSCGALTWAVLGLVVWVAIPVLAGWQASVITSGSMAPAIRSGDVIVSRPYDGGPLGAGSVVTFRDGRGGGLVTHRIVDRQGPRTYRTMGDANATPDSTLLSAHNVEGVGRYRVPAIGLLTLWIRQGDHAALLVSSLVATLVIAGSCRQVPNPPTSRVPRTRGVGSQQRRPTRRAAAVAAVTTPAAGRPSAEWPGPVWTAHTPRRQGRVGARLHPVPVIAAAVAVVMPAVVFAAGALAGTTAVSSSWSSGALDVPQDVVASRDCLNSEKQTTVTWSAVSTAGGADGYDVYSSDTAGGPYSLAGEIVGIDTTTYSHSGSALDASSYYVVRSASRSTAWRSASSVEVQSPSCA